MAVSGFEGFEKRLELQFFGDDPVMMETMSLRLLDFESLVQVLNAVQCTVVSAVGNQYFDAYVLSESSLFVYPTKIIIKTCGTTQLLKSIRPLLHHACNLGLTLCSCRYTRGSFIFPESQPFPHTSFKEEVIYIEENLPVNLCHRKASVMPSKLTSHSWHVFTASDQANILSQIMPKDVYTIEVCMTELDRVLARKFFQPSGDGKTGDIAGKEMTKMTGTGEINPGSIICDFAFDPCGYSMNGIDEDRYSTIHVTPEDGFSYASYECVFDNAYDLAEALKKVMQVFRPATMSIATTCTSHEVSTCVSHALEPLGLKCRSCAVDVFPAAGSVVFQTFTARRK